MNVSPATRYYVRRLLAAHPTVQAHLRDHHQPWLGSTEDQVERYIKLDYLTYPQLNELEFLIELHRKIKLNAPQQTHYLKTIEQKIFRLVAHDLPLATDAVTQLTAIFSDGEDPPSLTTVASTTPITLRQYAQYIHEITKVTERYLGKMIVRNYWLLTRPKDGWLSQIRLEQCSADTDLGQCLSPMYADRPLSERQIETLQRWIHEFIRHACRVLPTLPRLLLAAGIPSELLYDLVRGSSKPSPLTRAK